MPSISATVWHFQCPECGFGNAELDAPARSQEHCIVCLEEQGRRVMLCWWEGEAAEPAKRAPARRASVAA